jgi:hypothetical protein
MEADADIQSAESESPRCCPTCGTPYSGGGDSVGCPVCLFRRVLEPEPDGEQGSADQGFSPPDDSCFDHYEIVRRADRCLINWARALWGSPTVPWTLCWVMPWRSRSSTPASPAVRTRGRGSCARPALPRGFGTRTSPRFFITGCIKATDNAFYGTGGGETLEARVPGWATAGARGLGDRLASDPRHPSRARPRRIASATVSAWL